MKRAKEVTTGRCLFCQDGRLFYRWKAGRKRRLRDAYCVKCNGRLSQTIWALVKAPRYVSKVDPKFRFSSTTKDMR